MLSMVLNPEMRESGNERIPRSHRRVYNKLGRHGTDADGGRSGL